MRGHVASGQAEGSVDANAGSAMHASKTRITVGTWSSLQSMRLALKICGTSTQSARPGRVAVAEAPGRGMAGEPALDDLEPGLDPVPVPAVLVVVGDLELALQIAQHAQVVERMDLARDVERERAHAGAAERIGRQQRRLGEGLVEVLDDRERLRQRRLAVLRIVDDERRHELRRRDRAKRRRELLVLDQVDRRRTRTRASSARARSARGTTPTSGSSCRGA